jgi:hypothetical protein
MCAFAFVYVCMFACVVLTLGLNYMQREIANNHELTERVALTAPETEIPVSPTAASSAAATSSTSASASSSSSLATLLQWSKIQRILAHNQVWPLLVAKLLYYISSSIFMSVFALAAVDRFAMQADGLGFLLAFVGVTFGISQGILTGWFSAKFSDRYAPNLPRGFRVVFVVFVFV